jgi:hypothetical protein
MTFLGVPYRPTDSPLKRQNPEPIRDLVANFEELRAELEKTEWKHLLQIENEVGDSSR